MAIIHLTQENFESEIAIAQTPVLVDFWASWCGPCKMLAPILEELDSELSGRAKICKVNVDEQPTLAARFNIMSIPTVIFYNNGEETGKLIGIQNKDDIIAALKLSAEG